MSDYLKSLSSSQSNKVKKFFYSLSDQVLSIGIVFIANVMLARSGTIAEYGIFTLVYSIFIFFSGIHNALILEPYTVFASGNYKKNSSDYLQLILRSNLALCLALTMCLLLLIGVIAALKPGWYTPTMLGLTLGILFMPMGALFRRTYYVNYDSKSAARMSALFFIIACLGLAMLFHIGYVTGLSIFLTLSLGWIIVSPLFFQAYPIAPGAKRFLTNHPNYWKDHWRYARWVLATALVFQLVNQGYYWIVGVLLTVEDVGKLKAVQNIVLPVNLILTSMSLLFLPKMAATFQQSKLHKLKPLMRQLHVALLVTTGAFALFIWIAGNPILDFVYAGKYNDSVTLLYILGLMPIALGLGNVYNDALKAMERPKWVFFSYAAGGCVTILVGTLLILNYGLIGAAWGIVISSLTYWLILASGFAWSCKTISNKTRRKQL